MQGKLLKGDYSMYIYDTYDKTPQRDLGLASSAVEWNKDTRYLSGAFWFVRFCSHHLPHSL